MPTKKQDKNSIAVDEHVTAWPTKLLNESNTMEVDGPAVITEVIAGNELPISCSETTFTTGIDHVNTLNAELKQISRHSISEEVPDEIMDITLDSEEVLACSASNVLNESSASSIHEQIICDVPKEPESAKPNTSSTNTEAAAIKVSMQAPVEIKAATIKRSVTQTTTGQQFRLIPISQANAANIPLQQILQGHGANSAQLLLASPNKATLKSLGTINSSLLNSNKQSITVSTLSPASGSPIKQGIVVGKVLSPTKSPTKIAMIPLNVSKSSQVQKFLPTLSVAGSSGLTKITTAVSSNISTQSGLTVLNSTSPTVISASGLQRLISSSQQNRRIVSAVSPTKTIQVHSQSAAGSVIARLARPGVKQITANTLQGNKVQFIRLVSSTGGKTNATLVPVTALQSSTAKILSTVAASSAISSPVTTVVQSSVRLPSSNQIRMTIPIAPAVQKQGMRQTMQQRVAQKVLIPATNVSGVTQIGQSMPVSSLSQLPPGATIISSGNSSQNIVMVPAQYINQLQTASHSNISKSVIAPKPVAPSSTIPTIESTTIISNSGATGKPPVAAAKPADANAARPRKPCNCTKSQCLKLYCDCFANGEFCNDCNCNHCFNNLEHEEKRQKAIKSCLERNPQAFHPKIGKGRGGEVERRHNKGCNCKRSGCFKNYCECFEARILCTDMCKCFGCKNFEETASRKFLMHMADVAETRVQQSNDIDSKFSLQLKDYPCRPSTISSNGEKLPFSFVNKDVVELTCQCLIAQIEHAEKQNLSKASAEKLIFEEFGLCLKKIIDSAHKTKLPG